MKSRLSISLTLAAAVSAGPALASEQPDAFRTFLECNAAYDMASFLVGACYEGVQKHSAHFAALSMWESLDDQQALRNTCGFPNELFVDGRSSEGLSETGKAVLDARGAWFDIIAASWGLRLQDGQLTDDEHQLLCDRLDAELVAQGPIGKVMSNFLAGFEDEGSVGADGQSDNDEVEAGQ